MVHLREQGKEVDHHIASPNNRFQRPALRAAADAER